MQKSMIETMEDVQKYIEVIGKARQVGREAFFGWFDRDVSVDGSFFRADNTFCTMMVPFIQKYLDPNVVHDKISLDIGYGGGGQVYSASKIFKYSLGIDVHEEHSFVEAELIKRGSKNAFLQQCDGKSIPSRDNSIDFIHSWAVFMHLGCLYAVVQYLNEIRRVLKYGGVAVIYFSRLVRSKLEQSMEEYAKDIDLEAKDKIGATLTRNVPVNQINLRVALWKIISEAQRAGLTVIDRTCSFSIVDGKTVVEGQHGIILRKDEEAIINEYVVKE